MEQPGGGLRGDRELRGSVEELSQGARAGAVGRRDQAQLRALRRVLPVVQTEEGCQGRRRGAGESSGRRGAEAARREALMRARTAFVALPLAAAAPLLAGTMEVSLKLPVRARIDLEHRKTVGIAPFKVVSKEGEGRLAGHDVDIQKEFARYIDKLLKRESDLKHVDLGPIDFPTFDLALLSKNQDFWRAVGERSQADLLVAGSLDFGVQDRSGYRTEEYVSPFDGRTYYRQVLVEQTGYEYDIVLQVYDGKTGDQLYNDNFKDFKQSEEGQAADPLAGMFENLHSLEDRIVGVFAQRDVEATRVLFTD